MTTHFPPYTPYPDVNELLWLLVIQVEFILGADLVGIYLDGSLANGGFDEDSDIDFVVVTHQPVSPGAFRALMAMHDRLAQLITPWAIQLEGSYLSRNAVRRHDPQDCIHPNIERGWGERLKLVEHDAAWDIHRHILRERGIVLLGPHSKTLVDPVPPERLRQVMTTLMQGWGARLLSQPERINSRGYQSYVVLSLCRALYTLARGEIATKQQAVDWAREPFDARYPGLLERAWSGRHTPNAQIFPGDLEATLSFLRDVMAACQKPAND